MENNRDNGLIIEGKISVKAALENDKRSIYKIIVNEKKYADFDYIIKTAKRKDIPVDILPPSDFNRIVSGKTHGGLCACVSERRYLPLSEFTAGTAAGKSSVMLIEGVEDPFNYGYTVRSLYTLGISGLAVGKRNWSFAEPTILKSSTGTFDMLPITEIADNEAERKRFTDIYKSNGYSIYCIDKIKASESIFDVKFSDKSVFIIGGEKRGISKAFQTAADCFVHIPYQRLFSHSLTIQAAATITAYEWARQK